MISEINKSWNWKGFKAVEVLYENDFGNVIFRTEKSGFWRLCPEEISCLKIANTEIELKTLLDDSEFIEDWQMTNLISLAKNELGELDENMKYCLKMPAVLGGKYEVSNIGKINFQELISFSGNIGFQIKDLKDGQKIRFDIT